MTPPDPVRFEVIRNALLAITEEMGATLRRAAYSTNIKTRGDLVAFGGAGPPHANALARELGIPAVLVPPNPGIASAVGMLMTDLRHEFVTTRRVRLDALTPEALEALFADFWWRAPRNWTATACPRPAGACTAVSISATTASRSSCPSPCRQAR